MRTVKTIAELEEITSKIPAGTRLFWRVTRSIQSDKKRGCSINYASSRTEAGLSANEWDREFFSLEEALKNNRFYLYGIGCLHLVTGETVKDEYGREMRGADGEELLNAETVKGIARIPVTLNEEILSL